MTDRDRLIELIVQANQNCSNKDCAECEYLNESDQMCDTYNIADYLLANGVIVPPCKVGDMVYSVGIFTGQVIPSNVVGIDYTANDVFLHLENSTFISVVYQLGKTVFLTKEEAEAKLKECEKIGE